MMRRGRRWARLAGQPRPATQLSQDLVYGRLLVEIRHAARGSRGTGSERSRYLTEENRKPRPTGQGFGGPSHRAVNACQAPSAPRTGSPQEHEHAVRCARPNGFGGA